MRTKPKPKPDFNGRNQRKKNSFDSLHSPLHRRRRSGVLPHHLRAGAVFEGRQWCSSRKKLKYAVSEDVQSDLPLKLETFFYPMTPSAFRRLIFQSFTSTLCSKSSLDTVPTKSLAETGNYDPLSLIFIYFAFLFN